MRAWFNFKLAVAVVVMVAMIANDAIMSGTIGSLTFGLLVCAGVLYVGYRLAR